MKMIHRCSVWSMLVFAALCTGCGGGGGSSGSGGGTGTLSIGLTDTSTLKYKAVYVTIDQVQVNKDSGPTDGQTGWVTVATPEQTYNLLSLVNGVTAVLGDRELDAGTYRQIRLIIGKQAESENNVLGGRHPYANYVILNDGSDTTERLKVPSGFQTGLKLVHHFRILDGTIVELVLDFDACRSVVETGNRKFILKPTVKVIETEDKSIVFGDVTEDATALPISGALVSAQISEGLSAEVVRSTLTSGEPEPQGEYRLLLSPGQHYSVVAYSDRKVEIAGSQRMYQPACVNLTVPNVDTRRDFALETSGFGTIYGEVSLSGAIDAANPPVVYIAFFRRLDCGYVEIVSIPASPAAGAQTIEFSADLPLGTYDVVASSEGRPPDTVTDVTLPDSEDSATVELNL